MKTKFPEYEDAQRIAKRGEMEALKEHIFCESSLVLREYGPYELGLECELCHKCVVTWIDDKPRKSVRKAKNRW